MSLDNEIYRALAEQTADHILVTDTEGTILYVNPAFTTVTGYTQEEVLGKNPRILKSGLHDNHFYENLWQTVLSGQTFRGMSINKKKDGSLYYEEKTITPVKNEAGRITHLISTGKDVTERVMAENALAKSEAYSRHILDNVPDAVVTLDEDGRILGWNKEAEKMFGWQAENMIGRAFTNSMLVPRQQETQLDLNQELRKYCQAGKSSLLNQRIEMSGLHFENRQFPIELIIVPTEQEDQIIFHIFARDITEQKNAEAELKAYQHALQAKADSLATVNAIANSLHLSPDFQTVITRATEAIVEFTRAPSVAMFALNEAQDKLMLVASHGFSQETLKVGSALPVKGSLSGVTIKQKQVVTSETLVHDERVEPTVRQALVDQGLQNVVSLPLLFQEEVLGVVNLIYTEAQTLSSQDKETLLTIGKTIGLAMTNAQRLQNIKQNERQAKRRLEMSQALAASRTEKEVYQAIVDKAAYLPETAVSLWVHHDSAGTAVLELKKTNPAQSGLTLPQPGLKITIHERPQLFNLEQPLLTGDEEANPQLAKEIRQLADELGAASLAAFPLHAAGQSLGILLFASSQQDALTPDHLSIYQDLAEQGGLALRAAILNSQSQAALRRREQEVSLSIQVAQEIASATNLHELYQRVVTQVQEQFGYYYTQLLRYDETMDILGLVVGYGDVGQRMLEMNHSMPMGVGLIGQAAHTRQSILRVQVSDDPNWQANPLLPETRSELAVPIRLRDQVLGVLDVQSDRVNGITPNDQLLLEGLCGQIAIAIESTGLRQEMEGRLRELNLLQRQMSREGWLQYQQRREHKPGYQFDLSGLQMLTGQPAPPEHNQKNGVVARQTADSNLSKPLLVRGQPIGSFGIEADAERPLTDEERDIIDAVAQELAEALEAARLFEQTQMALAEQERLASELETVAKVSTAASTILEVDELLQSVVDLAKSSFDLYHVHIYLTNETGKKLLLKAGAGNIGRLMSLEGREINISDESIVARAARTRKGVLENNVRRTLDFLPHPLLPDTESEMALPMLVGGKLVGVLDLQSDERDFFTEEDLNVQTTLAAQIAVAVENANQYAAQVQTSTKLREVDQLKSEFLASMSHELRTPLNSIIGFADVLLEGLDGELNDRMEEDVRLIRESGNHLKGLIGDILDMSKIEAGRMDLRYEEIDMVQFTNDIMATAAPLAQEKNLYLHLDLDEEIRPLQADRTRLRQILWNILGNAIKFTEKGGITISVKNQTNHMLCSIRDTGIGIKENQVDVVFEQFRQIDGGLNRTAGGTGLGMPITKKLVELHGGEIWIESVYGQGSTFLFTLPYKPPVAQTKQTDAVVGAS